jgi:predicted dienelactone hydrolase
MLFAAVFARPAAAHAEKKPAAAFHVGITQRVFHPKAMRNWRGDPEKDLRCVVWYPTADTSAEVKQVIGPPDAPLFDAGMAHSNAQLAPALKGWPLVLLSHGTGGSALQMAWLATSLARAGFIVVAVDHPGNNSNGKLTPEGFTLWWERATDLSQVLDGMLDDEQFGKRIDKQRIGAAGFSLGGYTVMELAGAQTDISEYFGLCRQTPDDAVCHVPEMRGMGDPSDILRTVRKTSGESLARSEESFEDDRVLAVFAIAPALGFTLTEDSLRALRLPVELVVGGDDRIAPAKFNAQLIHDAVKGSKITVLPHVTHYTFLDSCTTLGKEKFAQYCEDSGAVRDEAHEHVAAMAVAFFERTLRAR